MAIRILYTPFGGGLVQEIPQPSDGARYLVVGGKCPECAAEPLTVRCPEKRIAQDDRAYESVAFCIGCQRLVGQVRAEVDTLFGLREDEAVLLHGRARVY